MVLVKIKSYWNKGNPKSKMTGVLIQRQADAGGVSWGMMMAETRDTWQQAKGSQGLPASTRNWERGVKRILPLSLHEETDPADTLILAV